MNESALFWEALESSLNIRVKNLDPDPRIKVKLRSFRGSKWSYIGSWTLTIEAWRLREPRRVLDAHNRGIEDQKGADEGLGCSQ
jgi:hypothetical protein